MPDQLEATRIERLVLIVDDNAADRQLLARYLEQDKRFSYRLIEETSVEEAVRICRSAAIDCVLLDYDLPDADGLEFLNRMIAENGNLPCAVIMLTGRGSEVTAVNALKQGALDYLVKGSFSVENLCNTVDSAIEKFFARPSEERRQIELEQLHQEAHELTRRRERLVLIVDDSPEDRMAVRRYLGHDECTYRFIEEGTGSDGLAVARSAGLDCVFLDYSLPDMNGVEFLDQLTGGTGIVPFPVIMLTGRGDETVAVNALKHGAHDYLLKGKFTAEGLRRTTDNAIHNVVARRLLERQRLRVMVRLEREARQRADELVEMDRRKNEFLAMLAHELRNPLAPIRNALQIMELPQLDAETATWARALAQRQVTHLSRLIDDLLDVSRITRGKIQLAKKDVDLTSVVRRSLEVTQALMEEFRHTVTLDICAEPVKLHADPARLEQIIVNLLNNAAKYTEPGGSIEITVDQTQYDAYLRIKDSGVGIAAEMLPRVFEMFAQVDQSLDRSKGGLGIGLTLVRELVDMHGGEVSARSDGLGKGSEFTVRFNLAEHSDASGSGFVNPVLTNHQHRRSLHILLVEDHVAGAESLATLLRLWGHDVAIAHDGLTGLEMQKTSSYQVVLLDIGLPRLNGFEVARKLRDEGLSRQTLMVAVTGYGQAEDRRRSQEMGFDYHLVKPVDPQELEKVLASCETTLEGKRVSLASSSA